MNKREEDLHHLHLKIAGDIVSEAQVNEIIAKKINEVVKEEKLQRDRYKD
jgi:hypothetical protein